MINFIEKYGWFVVGGLIGAIVQRLRATMSLQRFIATLGVSAFVGLCVGIIIKNYLEVPEEVSFVACSLSGVFAKDILDEVQQIISLASIWAKNKTKFK